MPSYQRARSRNSPAGGGGATGSAEQVEPDHGNAANVEAMSVADAEQDVSVAAYEDAFGPTCEARTPEEELAAAETLDPAFVAELRATPGRYREFRVLLDGFHYARLMNAVGVPIHERLDETGWRSADTDWDLFVCTIHYFPQGDRQAALTEIRVQERWEQMLDALGTEHVRFVQAWLNEDRAELAENRDLQAMVDEAHNSARGRRAMAVVDKQMDDDPQGRITARLRELLVLGVALPKLENQALSEEGVLSVNQVKRACAALKQMPDKEYIRLSMLLELTGDASRLQQSFLLLEATAARATTFGPVLDWLGLEGDLEELEGFADQTRDMDRRTLIDQTSVARVDAADTTGMTQKFTDSCGPTSNQVVRAEADPVEALEMNREGQLGQNALQSDAAVEQEQSLERHGNQTAVPRGQQAVIAQITAALPNSGCTAQERMAVLNFLNGQAYDNPSFLTAVPKLVSSMGASFPGGHAMRMVRESAGLNSGRGLTPTELVQEANQGQGVDDVRGSHTSFWDQTLWNLFTSANRQVNQVNMAAWSARVQTLLNRAWTMVDNGQDVVFAVYWNGGGGHFMTFTNVRTQNGGREFLVHDPWTGQTQWVRQAQFLSGQLPMGNALMCGLQG